MNVLRTSTLQGRLINLTMIASLLSMLCVLAGVIVYESTDFKPRALAQLQVPADILKELLRPALDFNSREDANRYLKKYCENQKGIQLAVVYDGRGNIFASYPPGGSLDQAPEVPESSEDTFSGRDLLLWDKIDSNKRTIGHLYLHQQLPSLFERLPQYGLMVGTVLGAVLILGIMFLLGARRNIFIPLRKLTDSIEKTNDLEFPLAVEWNSQDELGYLINDYNKMIRRLKESNDDRKESERLFRGLFENTEISVWNEDMSVVYAELNKLRSNGVSDLRQYLKENEQAAWDMTAFVKVIDVNQATLRLFGASNKYEIIHQIDKTFGSNAIDVFIDELCAIWDKQQVFRAEAKYKTLDGIELDLIISFQIPETADGFHSIPVNLIDITKRKKVEMALRESQGRLAGVIESAMDAVISIDCAQRVILFNVAAEEMFGYSASEMLGHPLDILMPQKFRAHHHNHVDTFGTTTVSNRTMGGARKIEALRANGEMFPVEASISQIELNEKKLYTVILRDITERKVAEENLITSNNELIRSNAELQQFAYVASHDLIEPLRSVSSSVQLLKMRYVGKLDARADEFIEHAVSGSKRMQALIEDLLAFARIGSGSFEQSSVDMTTIFTTACDNLRSAISESNAKITHDALPTITVNESQWVQLLQNLLANAIKFRGDKAVVIHLSAKSENNEWLFSVSDQGIGIEQQYFKRIFELFKRLHTRSEYIGTGVGLALCDKIINRHGGRIWVESVFGEGTRFFFTLPIIKSSKRSLP